MTALTPHQEMRIRETAGIAARIAIGETADYSHLEQEYMGLLTKLIDEIREKIRELTYDGY